MNSPASFSDSNSLVNDFTPSNLCLASNPLSILSGGFLKFLSNGLG